MQLKISWIFLIFSLVLSIFFIESAYAVVDVSDPKDIIPIDIGNGVDAKGKISGGLKTILIIVVVLIIAGALYSVVTGVIEKYNELMIKRISLSQFMTSTVIGVILIVAVAGTAYAGYSYLIAYL